MRLATLGPHCTRAALHRAPPHPWFFTAAHPLTTPSTPSRFVGTRYYYRVQGRVHVQGGRRKHVVPRCALQGRQAHALHMHNPQPHPSPLALALNPPPLPLCRHCYLGPWPHRFADAKSAAVRETSLPLTSSTPARTRTPHTGFSTHTPALELYTKAPSSLRGARSPRYPPSPSQYGRSATPRR